MTNTLSMNSSWRAADKARQFTREGVEWQNHSKSLRGRTTFEGFGRLPNDEVYHDSCQTAVYWVYSYATPIAWVKRNGMLVKPDVKYSVTTSKHQGRIY